MLGKLHACLKTASAKLEGKMLSEADDECSVGFAGPSS
jgi:hypothetical protein